MIWFGLVIIFLSFCFIGIDTKITKLVNHNSDLFDRFTPIYNYDISTTNIGLNLIKSIVSNNRYDCAKECSAFDTCVLLSFKSNQCNLYNKVDYSNFVISTTGSIILFEKYDKKSVLDANLIHYWPLNNNFLDIVGGANILSGLSYSFVSDRLNTPSSAVYLNNGYLVAPDNFVYFYPDFTVMMWIKIHSHTSDSRIFDFGGSAHDSVCFGISLSTNGFPWMYTKINGLGLSIASSTTSLSIGKWQHIAFTVKSNVGYYYVNGEILFTGPVYNPRAISRTGNYIGKSNFGAQSNPKAEIDDVKIFNKSLSKLEIIDALNSYY